MLTLLSPVFAAANSINLVPEQGFGGLANITVQGIIGGAVTLVLVVAAIIFFFMLIVGGIRWMISGGDKGQAESARGQVTGALIGLVIVFAAWAILTLVANLFGLNAFTSLNLPTFNG